MTEEEFIYMLNIINSNEKRTFSPLWSYNPDCDMWFVCTSIEGGFQINRLIEKYLLSRSA